MSTSTPLASDRHESTRWPRAALLTIAALTLAFAAMTGHRVFTAALWGDEIRTWRDGIEKPLVDVLAWRHHADHAPLGHLMARTGAALFGVDHAWSLRLGAWLCGIACVPLIALAGRAITGRVAAGLLMATMLVVDPNVAFQSAQARMYTALLLATLVALTMAAKLLLGRSVVISSQASAIEEHTPADRRRTAASAIGLALALGVGLWSHAPIYAVIVPLLLVAAGLLVAGLVRDRRVDQRAVVILAAAGVGLLIGIQGVLKLFRARNADPLEVEDPAAPLAQLEDATRALTGANWITALVVITTICGLVVIGRRSRPLAWLLGGIAVMAVANLMIAARYRPVAFARYLTVMQPALWACIAALIVEVWAFAGRAGFDRVTTRLVRGVVGVGFAVLCGFEIMRTIDVLPAHPLAAPFRDIVLAARADAAPIVVLPRNPYALYARYYGVLSEGDLAAAIAKVPNRRGKRIATSRPTDALSAPLTIVGVIPVRGVRAGTPDDPITLATTIARARGLEMPTIPMPDATLRVVRFDFSSDGGLNYSDPQAPRGPATPAAARADGSATRPTDKPARSRPR